MRHWKARASRIDQSQRLKAKFNVLNAIKSSATVSRGVPGVGLAWFPIHVSTVGQLFPRRHKRALDAVRQCDKFLRGIREGMGYRSISVPRLGKMR